jgi:uncharacterized protein (TIGR02246 family)
MDVSLRFRDYLPSDRDACLAIFDSNVPLYFGAAERGEFAAFLADLRCRYLVAEVDGAIVGCGGFYIVREGRHGGLAWGMVACAWQRRGIGARLLQTRLDWLSREPSIDGVRINTSQHTAAFFERFGFHTEDISADHFAPGLHRHRMLLRFDRSDNRRSIDETRSPNDMKEFSMDQQPIDSEDEAAVRVVVESWMAAVRSRDFEGILRNHAADIVMFDVPPPFQTKGIAAYKATWDMFFSWSDEPIPFAPTELQITTGSDVAFVVATMRCAEPGPDGKQKSLMFRLTIGLRKIDGRWIITHEHHSVPAGD